MTGLEPGSELGGFVIEAIIGRGGMGVVYSARQLRPERTVALKVIAPEFANDPDFRARFERESQVAAQIEHPNVIPVYAADEDAGVLYIAMRFVVGTDLRAVLAREGRLEPRRAATIVDQVAQALDAAHSRGLVHRDVKPSNVLLATSGGREHAYLTDFGLARHVAGSQSLTGTGRLVGTIDYVAPEQVRGERVDARTDVYSLGCMFFEQVTGTVPFPLPNDIAKLYAHNTQPPPVARERYAELPAALDDVLLRAMAKDPDDRFLSAGDLGRAGLAAADNTRLSRAERNVASGAAAPTDVGTVEALERGAADLKPVVAGPMVPAQGAPPAGATEPAAPGGRPPYGAAPSRRRWPLLAGSVLAVAAIAVVAVLATTGGGRKSRGGGAGATAIPAGDRLVALRRLNARHSLRYTVALSVPQHAAGGSGAAVPLTMSLLGARGREPLQLVQRERLPSPPYRFAKNSYVSDFKLDSNPDGSGNVGLSWYVHPGDRATVTCYSGVSFGGISLYSCG
jgi:hypothetical protein